MRALPKAPIYRYLTASPANLQRLRDRCARETTGTLDTSLYAGLELYQKPGQVADSWLFADRETLNKYLNVTLTELDLFELISGGRVKPNGPDVGRAGNPQPKQD